MSTQEEHTTSNDRRYEHIRAIGDDGYGGKLPAADAYDELLNHFDNHPDPNERALGQMLRCGVVAHPDPDGELGGTPLYEIVSPWA